jgi:hypothetical protein
MELKSLDDLPQHAGQPRGSILGARQLFPLRTAIDDARQDIVRAGDDLQGLAQIVTRHRQ